MSDPVSFSNFARELRLHAERCALAVGQASDRSEHIRSTQLALEAARLASAAEAMLG